MSIHPWDGLSNNLGDRLQKVDYIDFKSIDGRKYFEMDEWYVCAYDAKNIVPHDYLFYFLESIYYDPRHKHYHPYYTSFMKQDGVIHTEKGEITNGNIAFHLHKMKPTKEVLENFYYIDSIIEKQNDYGIWLQNGTLNKPRFNYMMKEILSEDEQNLD